MTLLRRNHVVRSIIIISNYTSSRSANEELGAISDNFQCTYLPTYERGVKNHFYLVLSLKSIKLLVRFDWYVLAKFWHFKKKKIDYFFFFKANLHELICPDHGKGVYFYFFFFFHRACLYVSCPQESLNLASFLLFLWSIKYILFNSNSGTILQTVFFF